MNINIDEEVFENQIIGVYNKITYIVLKSNVNNNNQVSLSYKEIAQKTGISKKSVQRAIENLLAIGIITKQNNKDKSNGAHISNTYIIYNKPIWTIKTIEEIEKIIGMEKFSEENLICGDYDSIFIKVYGDFLACSELTVIDKMVYVAIKACANSDSDIYMDEIPRKDLCMCASASEPTVTRAVKNLEEKNYIRVKRQGLNKPNMYLLYDCPEMWIDSTPEKRKEILDDIDLQLKFTLPISNNENNKEDFKKSYVKQPGYIYVMYFSGYYKIGKSKDCARLGEYTKLPEEPVYKIVEFVDDMAFIEKELHKKYDYCRQRDGGCEWFKLTEEDLDAIREYIKPYTVETEPNKYYLKYVKKQGV